MTKKIFYPFYDYLKKVNEKNPDKLLKSRLLEMVQQNFECIGLYDQNKLIGICRIWLMTKHIIGKRAKVDHVIIDENYGNLVKGKTFFDCIYSYLKEKDFEATELNTYPGNKKSLKFY